MQSQIILKKRPRLSGAMPALAALFISTMLSCFVAPGQTAGSYTFAQSAGTYTPVTGGSVLNATIPDSWQSGAITLSPAFYFCGTFYTTMWVTSNGVISLGGTAGPGSALYNGISGSGAGSGMHLCVFGADQIGSGATGASPEIRYQFTNNEHVIQWKDISRFPAGTDRFSYQARLNTITGSVTYVYSVASVGVSTNYQPAIGIRTAATAGNWQSRLVTAAGADTWATSLPAAATSDLLRFTSTATNPKQPVSGQSYVWTPPAPPPSCSSLTFPATSTTVPGTTSICVSGLVSLSLGATMPTGGSGIRYVWQYYTTNPALWTSMDTTYVPAYITTPAYVVNSSRYFRCLVQCNGTTVLTTTTSPQVVVNVPGAPTGITPATRCGPGSVTLSATPAAGATAGWYAAATGGVSLSNLNSFTTPYLTATTTYYTGSEITGTPATGTVGTGTLVNTAILSTAYPGPYGQYFGSAHDQYLITAGEMAAAGISPGIITSIAFDLSAGYTGNSLASYKIQMANTSATALTTSLITTGFTPVIPSFTYTPPAVAGFATINFTTPFVWDGSNIVVDISFSNCSVCNGTTSCTTSFSTSGQVKQTSTAFASAHSIYADNNCTINTMSPGGATTNNTYNQRPNMRFNYTSVCSSPRQAVTATINPSPAVTKTFPAIVCNNAVKALSVASSPMSNYSNYSWTPVANLYTDAAGTIPYTASTNAPTVYMKSSAVGQNTYYMFASNPTASGCTFADTLKIWVQPDSVTIKAFPDTICAPSGTTTLKLVPNTGYAPNTIQWRQSTDGIYYTDIPGATSVTYTTPSLTANRWYKAVIRGGSDTCQAPVKPVVFTMPQLTVWADSFHCGPGAVTLAAQSGGNSGIRWYSSAGSNTPVGTGSPWTTPYLAATTTYYVGAGTGTVQPVPANVVVTGTQTTGSTSSFLYYFYKGSKTQYIITAAQMIAQGYGPGLITALGIQTGSIGNTTMNNVTIELGSTGLTTLAAFQPGLQQVYSAATFTLTANAVNTFTFQTPFYWDGQSNIIVGMCRINNTTNTSVNNYVYRSSGSCIYRYGDASDMCSAGTGTPAGGTSYGPFTASITPHTLFTMQGGCETPRQAVTAYIRPVPSVDIGPDINKCVDAGAVEVLNAGVQANTPQFLWDNGSTSQVRAVTQSGTYSVRVTNQYTCHDEDTVVVIMKQNPVVNLGNDTTVCNGVILPLNAGPDGIDYFWNTGQTSQAITINAAGSYNVFVTNSLGCVKTDTIVVNMAGELPTIQGINVSNNGINSFHFTALNPQHVIGYDWDFGDNTAHSYSDSPTHVYAVAGNYIVTLLLSSSCGFRTDSSAAHIVGIHQLNVSNDELTIYPNPARTTATILNKGTLKMESVSVYNLLGQVVYKAAADSKDKHSLQLDAFAAGVYTVEVFTDKGTVARKLEIVK